MSWLTSSWEKFTTELKVLGALFDADVWPYIKSTILLFLSDEGKVILSAAITAAPTMLVNWTGAVAEVASAAVAAAPQLAEKEAAVLLNQIQTSLQMVKNTSASAGAGDTTSLAAVQSAQATVQPVAQNAAAGEDQVTKGPNGDT